MKKNDIEVLFNTLLAELEKENPHIKYMVIYLSDSTKHAYVTTDARTALYKLS